MPHPIDVYRPKFEEMIFALRPRSVLDVGCGQGAFLGRAAARGIAATGIDVREDRVSVCREAGLDVRCAEADRLPFEDGSFDCVSMALVAHHLPSLRSALAEALRVGRRGVFAIDPWYDETIPSQRSKAELERWMKRVDRKKGGVNNGPLTAGDFVDTLGDTDCTVEICHRLLLRGETLADAGEKYASQLDGLDTTTPFRDELDALLERAATTGLTTDGAIMLAITR
ncbi:MAG TPA: class I SAM-dependent methyltransferase [Rhizomicrobium sp.]